MNLQENIQRIREMIGVVTEENNDSKKLYRIQVSSPVESKNSIGVLVHCTSGSDLKSIPQRSVTK